MKKLEAATRDRAAAAWRERKVMYKVGSYFKGCSNCGETEEVEVGNSGRMVLRYLSGYQVFRAYQPKASGFTYYCYECSAKDLRCWPNALDIGMDAIVGSRDSVRARKAEMRRDAVRNDSVPRAPSRASEIARLEAELARLMEMLKNQ
jgi:hypothetical protein